MKHFFTRFPLSLVLPLALAAIGMPGGVHAQTNGEFRSDSATGTWANAAIWSVYNSTTASWSQATAAPTGVNAIVTVRTGHIVTIAANATFKRLTIQSGAAVISSAASSSGSEIRLDMAGDTSMLVNNGTIGSATLGGPERIIMGVVPTCRMGTLTGTGTTTVSRIRLNTSTASATLSTHFVVDQNMTITSSGITAYYNTTTNTNAESATITINAGRTVTMSGALNASSSSVMTNAGGTYTYNINGTLDMSTTGTTSYFWPLNNSASVITVNVAGLWKVNNLSMSPATTTNTGAVKMNVLSGGLVDLSRATNFIANSKFFVLSGTGSVRRAVPTTATSVVFPIGTADNVYNPLTLTPGTANDTFTVNVRNALSYTIGDPSKIVTKQWEIIPYGSGAGVTPSFGWMSADQAAGFTTSAPMRLFRYNAGPPAGYAPVAAITAVTGAGTLAAPYSATPATTPSSLNGLYVVGDSEAAVVVIPTVTIAASPGTTSCAGVPVQFSATTTNITGPHFQWKVNGVNAGADSVNYTTTSLTNGAVVTCEISYVVNGVPADTSNAITMTINPQPIAGTITGPGTVCTGTTGSLSSTVAGGTWTSSNPAVATVSTSGVVSGVTVGNVTISYAVTNSCGTATATQAMAVTLGVTAGTISGTSTICPAGTAALTSTAPGGVWTSSNTSVATVSSAGALTGVAGGTATVSYIVTNGCGSDTARRTITVNPAANAGLISGPKVVCRGSSITLATTVSGGTWTAGSANATVTSAGVVTGVASGTVVLTYTVTNSCGSASVRDTLTVSATPVLTAITGPSSVCPGATIALADSVAGGIWTVDNGFASVSPTGVVTGLQAGASVVSYTLSNACGIATVSKTVTVGALPVAATITARDTICVYRSFTASVSGPAGVWSTARGRAVVATDGLITGISYGEDTLIYSVSNACGTARSFWPLYVVDCFPAIVPTPGFANGATIFPNPNNGSFTFRWSETGSEPVRIVVTDMLGAVVASYKTRTNADLAVRLNASPGMYLVTATTEHSQQRMKVNTAR